MTVFLGKNKDHTAKTKLFGKRFVHSQNFCTLKLKTLKDNCDKFDFSISGNTIKRTDSIFFYVEGRN